MSLFLAAVLFLQGKTPEEVLKKLEETVDQASTVRLKFKVEGSCVQAGKADTTWTYAGTLSFKGDNRVNALSTHKQVTGDKKQETDSRLICDGTRLLHDFPPGRKRLMDLEFFSIPQMRGSLVRAGVVDTLFVAGTFGDLLSVGGGGPKPRDFFEVSDLKTVPANEHKGSLTYSLKFENERFPSHPTNVLKVTLEYDPETWRLRSRTVTLPFEGGETRIRETYEDFSLNADIPDETFTLPEK
jgi:outer membrane lipoprotein-sorting protein